MSMALVTGAGKGGIGPRAIALPRLGRGDGYALGAAYIKCQPRWPDCGQRRLKQARRRAGALALTAESEPDARRLSACRARARRAAPSWRAWDVLVITPALLNIPGPRFLERDERSGDGERPWLDRQGRCFLFHPCKPVADDDRR